MGYRAAQPDIAPAVDRDDGDPEKCNSRGIRYPELRRFGRFLERLAIVFSTKLVLAGFVILTCPSIGTTQFDLEALEGAVGKRLLGQLQRSVKPCNSAFIRGLNETLLDALVDGELVTRKPIVHIFNMSAANAFAVPSGQIIVTTNLIATLRSSEEYAGVVYHEVGHIALGHLRQKMMTDALRSMLLSGDAVAAPAYLLKMQYSQAHEAEADKFAAKALARIGVSPTRLGVALTRIEPHNAKSKLVNTHPVTADRVKSLEEYKAGTARAPMKLPEWRNIDLSCQ